LNFVAAEAAEQSQTGADGPWLGMLRALSPFQINQALVRNGQIHLRAYWTPAPLDVYLSGIEATIDDLGNIYDQTKPLVATAHARGRVMDQATFELKMALDPFAYRPTFHLAARILGLDVRALNDLATAYGNLDFQKGWFDFVLEAQAREGQLSGYAKPLFRDLQVFHAVEDARNSNPLEYFWQALIGATTSVFKNHPRDQFGTMIPFTGDLSEATTADILATLGNVLRNAFIRAYLPHLEHRGESGDLLQFGPPDFSEMLSVVDSP
jgi:hypothetical protein